MWFGGSSEVMIRHISPPDAEIALECVKAISRDLVRFLLHRFGA